MTNKERFESNTGDALTSLLAEIERAWLDRGERPAIERLVREHPEFETDLREFSSCLFDSGDTDVEPEFLRAESNVYDWLLHGGIAEALSEAATARRETTTTSVQREIHNTDNMDTDSGKASDQQRSDSWITFLYRRSGCQRNKIAATLPNVTLEFLVLVSRYPDVIPFAVKAKLAESAQQSLGVPADESLQCLSGNTSPMRRAASRSRPADRPPQTFEDILELAAFDDAARAFWRNYEGVRR
jgi:hypothetical protein